MTTPPDIPPPRAPLPDDLAWRLDSILTGRLSGKPSLAQDIRALVQDAFERQPIPETVAAMTRQLAEAEDEIRYLLAEDGIGDDPVLAAKIRAILPPGARLPHVVLITEDKLPAGDVPAAPGQLAAYLQGLIKSGLNPIEPQGWPARERFRERYLTQPVAPEPMRIGDGGALPSDRKCPDDGACHHGCTQGCFRVAWAGPLSGVFPGDTWPAEITAEYGTQDGVL